MLTLFNDQILFTAGQLKALVASHKAGDMVILSGYRQGKEFKLTAWLQSKVLSPEEKVQLGMLFPLGKGWNILSSLPADAQKLISEAIAGKASPGTTPTIRSMTVGTSVKVFGPDGKEISSGALSDPNTQKMINDALAKLSATTGSIKVNSGVTVIGPDGKVISSQTFSDPQSSPLDPAMIRKIVQDQLNLLSTAKAGGTNAAPSGEVMQRRSTTVAG